MKLSFPLEPPLHAAPESGLSAVLFTVEQALAEVSGSLAPHAQSRVHWRLAASMLRMARIGTCKDIPLVRQTLSNALESEGWLLEAPGKVPSMLLEETWPRSQ